MTTDHAAAVLLDLKPEELPAALRLLAAMEMVGWASPEEAAMWRARIAAVRIFHEDAQPWIEGPEA